MLMPPNSERCRVSSIQCPRPTKAVYDLAVQTENFTFSLFSRFVSFPYSILSKSLKKVGTPMPSTEWRVAPGQTCVVCPNEIQDRASPASWLTNWMNIAHLVGPLASFEHVMHWNMLHPDGLLTTDMRCSNASRCCDSHRRAILLPEASDDACQQIAFSCRPPDLRERQTLPTCYI